MRKLATQISRGTIYRPRGYYAEIAGCEEFDPALADPPA
jgi:hypothetical protein